MKYLVDIERRISKIKTFEVEADSQKRAQELGELMAKSVLWDMSGSYTHIEVMSANILH